MSWVIFLPRWVLVDAVCAACWFVVGVIMVQIIEPCNNQVQIFMEIFERLKSERERLQLSQPRVAELANVGKTTVINWEKGASAPDAVQLSALAATGIDVLFVITGQRSQGLPPAATLPPDQQVLITNYERCKPEGKQHLIQASALMSAGLPVTTAAPGPKRGAKPEGRTVVDGGANEVDSGHALVEIRGNRNRVRTGLK